MHTHRHTRRAQTGAGAARPGFSVKELITGIVIAFAMAFIFRGFVIEGFLIPTGSMAPTLLGKHVRVVDPASGYEWTAGPADYVRGNQSAPLPLQGAQAPYEITNPLTGNGLSLTEAPLLAGDRVFVMKYLEGVLEPERWEVVVFKVPTGAQENFIKRLVGLPGEQLALVDGDVFYRRRTEGDEPEVGPAAWDEDDWTIARKPERTQRAMLQTVFDSAFTPPPETQEGLPLRQRFRSPWTPETRAGSWEGLDEPGPARFTAEGATRLVWDTDRYPIDDYTPYNQTRGDDGEGPNRIETRWTPYQRHDRAGAGDPFAIPIFPVSDVAVTLAVAPGAEGVGATIELAARGRLFEAVIDGGTATLRWRVDASGAEDQWNEVASAPLTLDEGRLTELEFWHVDQALWLFADGELIAGGPDDGAYAMNPAERVYAATGRHLAAMMAENPSKNGSPLARPANYRSPRLAVTFTGGPVEVRRSVVSRDIFYQPRRSSPARATHPMSMPTLGPDHYFFCGDNSPNSEDSRAWDTVDPWVTRSVHGREPGTYDPTGGLVHRDLIVGRAFAVYLPAPTRRDPLPVPMLDFGRMRWIW